MKLSRREVLAGSAAALAACGARFELNGPFPLDVTSGDVTATTALLWTMYRGNGALKARVWREGESTPVLEQPAAALDGFVHFDAAGLEPFTWYGFDFGDGDERSAPGRFRTTPAAGQSVPLTFGAVSCTKLGFPLTPLKQAAMRRDLDAFLFLGDTVYSDGADDLDGFRDKWSQSIAHPNHHALRAATSAIDTWDDHEMFDNWNADNAGPPDTLAGLQAFYEHQPLHPGPGRRIWRSLKWGATAEVFVLDCRGERRPSRQQYVSPDQLEWLKDALSASTASFRIIMNSVPISNFPGAFFGLTENDRWQGYPAQREDILGHIEDTNLRGVLWLAGDFHLACMGRVSRSGRGTSAIEALVGPGGQTPNVSPSYPDLPQFDWASGINNFTTVQLDPTTLEATLTYTDGNGRVLTRRTYSL